MGDSSALVGFTLRLGATRSAGIDAEQMGGGVYCETTSQVLSNCFLMSDVAANIGGGAYQGTLNDCVLGGDTALQSGGGSYEGLLNNCILSNNFAMGSGGAAQYSTLNGCTLIGNSANNGGGAQYCNLTDCLISGNQASWGAGVFNRSQLAERGQGPNFIHSRSCRIDVSICGINIYTNGRD